MGNLYVSTCIILLQGPQKWWPLYLECTLSKSSEELPAWPLFDPSSSNPLVEIQLWLPEAPII